MAFQLTSKCKSAGRVNEGCLSGIFKGLNGWRDYNLCFDRLQDKICGCLTTVFNKVFENDWFSLTSFARGVKAP